MAAFSLPQDYYVRKTSHGYISAYSLISCEQSFVTTDLKDDELDPMYVEKREQWKELVASVIRPKVVQGNLQLERRYADAGKSAAGRLKGMKPVIELASGVWWEQPGITSAFDITACLKDGNILSSIGWSAILWLQCPIPCAPSIKLQGRYSYPEQEKGRNPCHRDLRTRRSPNGHNLFITADWNDISVYDYDCLVVLGGRSLELLVMNDQAVDLMKELLDKRGPLLVLGMGKGNGNGNGS
ncbi:hypothetical protein GQ457_06G029060 [Hibiscus cannabinus]